MCEWGAVAVSDDMVIRTNTKIDVNEIIREENLPVWLFDPLEKTKTKEKKNLKHHKSSPEPYTL